MYANQMFPVLVISKDIFLKCVFIFIRLRLKISSVIVSLNINFSYIVPIISLFWLCYVQLIKKNLIKFRRTYIKSKTTNLWSCRGSGWTGWLVAAPWDGVVALPSAAGCGYTLAILQIGTDPLSVGCPGLVTTMT